MNYNIQKNKSNIEIVRDQGLCTGCGTCVGICPNSAIKLLKDESKGIFLPQVSSETCKTCGICFTVCPGHSVNFNQLNNYFFNRIPEDIFLMNYLKCYTGYACDCNIRYNSTSGGVVTSLLCFCLEEGVIDGALVSKMRKDKPLEPDPFIARSREEILISSTSKYCPVPANIALREILNSELRVAIVGLPCHIQGVRKAMRLRNKLGEELRRKVVILLGLFCGMSRNFLATESLLKNLNVRKEDVKAIRYRGEGWPGNISLELKNGTIRSIPYPYSFDHGRVDFIYTPLRCLLCMDRVSELADISFGDAWFPEFKGNDHIGRSKIICRSIVGEQILNTAISKKILELQAMDNRRLSLDVEKLLREKKAHAHIFVFKMFGQKVPKYNQTAMKPKLKDILGALSYHFSFHILSHHYSKEAFKYLITYLRRVKTLIKS